MTTAPRDARHRLLGHLVTWAAFLIPAVTYSWFCAPGLTWLDSGELVASSWALGTAHPPGHPLYASLARALVLVLPGNLAFRYNLVSIIFAILTLAVARAMMKDVLSHSAQEDRSDTREPGLQDEICATAGTLLLAFIPPFANQALRAEVYTMGFFLTSSMLWACLRMFLAHGEDRTRLLVPVALFAGLGLTVHNLTIVLLSPVILLSAVPVLSRGLDHTHRRALIRTGAIACATFIVALLPYVYNVLRSMADPYIDLSHAESMWGLVGVFSGKAYGGSFARTAPGLDLAGNLLGLWKVSGAQMNGGIIAMAIATWAVLWRRHRLLAATVTCAVVLPLLGVVTQKEIYPANPDHGAYVFPTILALALLATVTVRRLPRVSIPSRGRILGETAASLVTVLLAAALVFSQFFSSMASMDMRDSDTAHAHGDLLDSILPADSTVFLNNDEVAFPLLYLQVAEGRRLDVMPVISLQVTSMAGYDSALANWPDRLPRPRAMRISPTITAGRHPVIDGIVNHDIASHPVFWDFLDGRTVSRDRLVPYYHLARILPPGPRTEAPPGHGQPAGWELAEAFHAFFAGSRHPPCDEFALGRLATGPIASAALLHYELGDLGASIAADSVGLELSPGAPLLLYNRAVSLEKAGLTDLAGADYIEAGRMGYDDSVIHEALERLELERP